MLEIWHLNHELQQWELVDLPFPDEPADTPIAAGEVRRSSDGLWIKIGVTDGSSKKDAPAWKPGLTG